MKNIFKYLYFFSLIVFSSCSYEYELIYDSNQLDDQTYFWGLEKLSDENDKEIIQKDSLYKNILKISVPKKGKYKLMFTSVFGDEVEKEFTFNMRNQKIKYAFPKNYFIETDMDDMKRNLLNSNEINIYSTTHQMIGSKKELLKIKKNKNNLYLELKSGINHNLFRTRKVKELPLLRFDEIITYFINIEQFDHTKYPSKSIIIKYDNKLCTIDCSNYYWRGMKEIYALLD